MSYFAPRTCTELSHESGSRRAIQSEGHSRALEDLRELDAYVLLGTPGAGKTESFKREADMPGCAYITARDFLVFGEQPGNAGTTFFIDGLDERRAGLSDGRTPLDEIRRKLDQLGRPRFRLSCREADWFGANDREHLKAVSPDGGISVVRLDPLPEKEVGRVLEETFGISNPAAFIASAKEQGIGDLLSNPQMLRMLVEAVNQSGGQIFPRSRAETFDLACRQLLGEHSGEHQLASGKPLGVDALMNAAGRLCAVQLLAGTQGYRLPGGVKAPDFPNLDQVDEGSDGAIRHAIRSKLFHTPSEGHVAPIHRQVAEFLAARHLAGLISNGLPLRRVLSLMTGYDGIIVSELRGLSAWLAAHSKSGRARAEITARDPLGTLLYGDVRDWSAQDKALLLEHLGRKSKKNPWSFAAIDEVDSERLFRWLGAAPWADDRGTGVNERISLAAVKERLAEHSELQEMFKEKLGRYEDSGVRDENDSVARDNEREQRRKKERQHLKPHEAALRENRADPGLLYKLALVYLGAKPRFRGGNPRSRLFGLLGDDHDLVEAVLRGLRGSIDRPDIPSDDEVIRLSCESKRHILAVPIVAGLEERACAAPDHHISLEDDKLRVALAVHYTEPHWGSSIGGDRCTDQKSLWFTPLLKSHPHIVSEVLSKFALAKLRSGADGVDGLHELAHFKDHRAVARLAVLPLLEAFPVRCKEAQLQDLRHLLHSAALNVGERLVPLIERKLTSRSMNPGQRVYWLAAGMLLSADKYVGKLDAYMAGGKRRVQNLERFLDALFEVPPGLLELLDIPALKLLVRHVGANSDNDPAVWRSDDGEGCIVTQGMGASLCVRGFINQLASNPSPAATEALRELGSDDRLAAWRSQLLNAAEQQERTRREGEFRHPSLEQALATLRNQKPANAADLAALVTDQIVGISGNIRNGNASGWRQYWNVDSRNRPEEPRPEDACRDALLSDLQQNLSGWGIDAQPEGRYADDKRADIRVSCNGFNVPVEIKRSCHRDVWSAIENQLIAKYARDPGADGHGIYVIFWFGSTRHCSPQPGTAGTPRSAAELERRIKESLAEGVLRKISVCAVDVANTQT